MSDFRSPKEALENYFNELLADEEVMPKPLLDYVDPKIEQQKLEKLLRSVQPKIITAPLPITPLVQEKVEIQEWHIEPSPALSPVPAAEPVTELEHKPEALAETSAAPESIYTVEGLEWGSNGLPQWAQRDFDVLLFQVSGLTLAVPLISLGQIQPLTEELTPLFGQADWFMGLLPTPAGKIRTVNTAKFVMPERYDESFLQSAKYVISLNGVPWGLAVDSVNQPITLKPDDVKWRGERTKRPWLAGTVKEHMCALLDVPMIGHLLMSADRNARKTSARKN